MVVPSIDSPLDFSNCAPTWPVTVRAVVVEPAGVLYDPTPRRRWLWQLVTRLGLRRSYDEFIRPWSDEFLPPVHRGERRYAQALRSFLQSLGLSSAQLNEIEAAMPLRGQPLETGVRPLHGVSKTLSRLAARGIALAVLGDSSLSSHDLREQLDNLGLGGHFATVVSSVDLHTTKPNPINYETVAASLRLTPPEIAFASCANADLTGATAAGMRSIAIKTDVPVTADAVLPTFARVDEVISRWTASRQMAG